MRQPLASLDGKRFAVAVIGAGVNGASAAQHIAAAGHDVLLVDKGDFGAGSSSRSIQSILPPGIRWPQVSTVIWIELCPICSLTYAMHAPRWISCEPNV